jgi:hypothetical protein
VADGRPRGRRQGVGDGGQCQPDDGRHPLALTEGHDEPTNGPPVLDELQDGALGGAHPPHHRSPGRSQPSVKDVAVGIEMGEAPDVQWGLGLADISDHDLIVWIATADHDPAGIQEGEDALGGDPVRVLTGGGRTCNRVEQVNDPGLGVGFDGLSPAGSPGEARHQTGAEQQRDRDHLGD